MTENTNITLSAEEIRANLKAAIVANIGENTPEAVVEELTNIAQRGNGSANFRSIDVHLVEEVAANNEAFSFVYNDIVLTVITGTKQELKYLEEYHQFLDEEDYYQDEFSYEEFVTDKGYEDGFTPVEKPFTEVTSLRHGEEYLSSQRRLRNAKEELEKAEKQFAKSESLFYLATNIEKPTAE